MVGALMFRSGIASGKRVEAHIIVSKYWFPLFVFGNGPTQSIITREKGSSNAGMGIRGALGISFGLVSLHADTHHMTCRIPQHLDEVLANKNDLVFVGKFC